MIRSILFCFLLIFMGFNSFSQTEEDELEDELLELVNEYREQQGLPFLEESELLSAAAFDQAEYILKNNKVVHLQEKGKKETLAKRILYYEGLYAEAGENAAIIGLQSKAIVALKGERVTIENEYMALQAALVSWLKEEDGAANLNDPNFYDAGITVLTNEKSELVIVLILASLPYENDLVRKIPVDLHGIEGYKKEVCAPFLENYPTLPQLFSDALKVAEGKVFFEYHDLNFIKSILSNSKASFAVDVILNSQYDCSIGNRLFPTAIADGYLMSPITKSALNMNNQKDSLDEVKISLGNLPEFYDPSKDELNLKIISDGHYCTTVPFNRIISKNNNSVESKFLLSGDEDSTIFVWVDSSSIMYYPAIEENWQEAINNDFALLDELSYDFESISVIVQDFQMDDKQSVSEDDFSSLIERGATVSIVNAEEEFNNKIKGTFYQLDLGELEKTDYAKYVLEKTKTDTEFKAIVDSLTQVTIITKGKANVASNLPTERKKEFYLQMVENGKNDLALYFQTQLIKSKDKKLYDLLLSKEFAQITKNLNFINNQIVLTEKLEKDKFGGNPIHLAFLELYLIKSSNAEIKFNYLKSKLQHWRLNVAEANGFESWLKEYRSLSGQINKYNYNRELLNYYLFAVDYYYNNNEFANRKKAFTQLMKIQQACELSADEKLLFAQFLCYQDQFNLAAKFLKKELFFEEVDENLLYYYLQIAQYTESEFPDEKYVELLKKAEQLNSKRFCELFSTQKMGIQLLRDSSVKELYCEKCP